jgi:hypothetical protein
MYRLSNRFGKRPGRPLHPVLAMSTEKKSDELN